MGMFRGGAIRPRRMNGPARILEKENNRSKVSYFFILSDLSMSEFMPEPVVAAFGFGMQVPSGFATFSQSAIVAKLQFVALVALLVLQNALPVATRSWLAEPDFSVIVAAALATEMLAAKAATAVSAVNIFMLVLLEWAARSRSQRIAPGPSSGNSRPVEKKSNASSERKCDRGSAPRPHLKSVQYYASMTATISWLRGSITTISSPTMT
jgi:hypothetical protein